MWDLDEFFLKSGFINIPAWPVSFRVHISLRVDQHVMTKMVKIFKVICSGNVAKQNKELVNLMSQHFLCGEPGLLSRPEQSRVLLNPKRV